MFSPLLDLSFWFSLRPELLSPVFQTGFFVLFSLLVFAGAVLRIFGRQKKYDKYTRTVFFRLGTMKMAMGIIGFTWLFFSFETIYLLGARFWFLVWLFGLVYWLYTIRRYALVEVPQLKIRDQSRAEANRYLPRRSR